MLFGRRLLPHVMMSVLSVVSDKSPIVHLGVLRFGTLSWELDVIRHYGLDAAAQVVIDATVLVVPEGIQIAFQAGYFDMIVLDWLRVAQQRSAGLDWTFVPFSNAVGALITPAGSSIRSIADLPGHTLGIAGTRLDKNWLILRAYASKLGVDLDTNIIKAFAPPATLSLLMKAGRLDAQITFWPFVAKAEAHEARVVLTVEDAVRNLGVDPGVPYLGYVFSQRWAKQNKDAVDRFLTVSHKARMILATSDEEWQRLQPITGATTDAELIKLRDWYRSGIPQHWGNAERHAASQLLPLTSALSTIPDGTFWPISW